MKMKLFLIGALGILFATNVECAQGGKKITESQKGTINRDSYIKCRFSHESIMKAAQYTFPNETRKQAVLTVAYLKSAEVAKNENLALALKKAESVLRPEGISYVDYLIFCKKMICINAPSKEEGKEILEEMYIRDLVCENKTCNKKYAENLKTFKRCGKCKTIYYCSKECQTENWQDHKKLCRANDLSKDSSGAAAAK